MDVVSHCALPVAGRVWMPKPGAAILTFVCKATFVLGPGKFSLAGDQQPVHEVDCPWSDEVRSLYAASDLAPRKLRADVVLIGAAFAPGGVPVPRLTARLTLGEMSKAVDVWCDRTLRADGSVVEGAPFTHLPLLYERAAGGPGTSNPVGMSQQPDPYGAVALPNLTAPGARVGINVGLEPTAFGPLGARWPGRLTRLGRHADAVSPARWHEQPLPPDLDMGYFQVAPPDQQAPLLNGGERIILENLHPEHPRLEATVPVIHPRAQVTGPGGERSASLRCDTLWIDTSGGLCAMTYRGQVLLGSPTEQGRVVVTLDDPDEAAPISVHTVAGGDALTGTLAMDEAAPPPPQGRRPAATLPFVMSERPGGAPKAQPVGGLPFRMSGLAVPTPLPPPSVARARDGNDPGPGPRRARAARPAPRRGHASCPRSRRAARPSCSPAAGAHHRAPADAGATGAGERPLVPAPTRDGPGAVPVAGPGAGTIAPVTGPLAQMGPAPGDFRAAGSGSLLASNAAAGVTNEMRGAARAPEPSRALIGSAPAPRAAPREPADAVDLVFFDTASLPRIRRVPAWKKLLAKLDDRPLASGEDDPAAAGDPVGVEDRREILEILVHAEPGDAAGLDEALGRAVDESGRFFAPLLLLAGEIQTPFDEVETLKSTVTTVTPLIGNDEGLRATVEVAKEFLKLPGLSSSPAVTEGLTGRVRDAFNGGKRSVPAGYLDAQTERALLEQRFYQKRRVLGGPRQRALFQFLPASSGAKVHVVYLPDDVGMKLPMYARFKVRMIARVQLPLDQYEQGTLALEALALARLVTSPKRPS